MAEIDGGMSAGQTQAMIEALMPRPATAAPPAVQVDSAKGDASEYALANHTHESRLQARRVEVTPDAQGRTVYVFPKPYPAGVVPIVAATAETPTGVNYRNDVSVLQGSTTNERTTLVLTRLNNGISLLGLGTLNLFQPVTTTAFVNVMSRAPS